MAKKIKIEITEPQLNALLEIIGDLSAMIGCASDEQGEENQDLVWRKQLRLINKMLDNNKIKH